MSELKASKGPYVLHEHNKALTVRDGLNRPIAEVWHFGGPEIVRANAHLLRSARELYEALARAEKELRWAYYQLELDGAACLRLAADEARRALASARGETPEQGS